MHNIIHLSQKGHLTKQAHLTCVHAALGVAGTEHVVCDIGAVPRRLSAHGHIDYRQLHLVQRVRPRDCRRQHTC